jgi:hypothetical protein
MLRVLTRSGGTLKTNFSQPFHIMAATTFPKVLWQPFYETSVLPEKTWIRRSVVLEPTWSIGILGFDIIWDFPILSGVRFRVSLSKWK